MWSGFSSDEIKRLHLENSEEKDANEIHEDVPLNGEFQFPEGVKTSKINKSSKKINQIFISRKTHSQNECLYPVPPEARLTQPRKEETSNAGDSCSSNSSLEMVTTSGSSHSSICQNANEDTSPSRHSSGSQGKAVTILVGEDKSYKVIASSGESDPQKAESELNGELMGRPYHHQKAFLVEANGSTVPQDKTSLEKFQERQKMMEEQNKRKKDLLTKAIADRKRRTQSEAQKLVQIQEELGRLDALLSTDVGILRNQIELASLEFNEAQKRYDKAESEFIEAKIHLFNKLERKELLTEHLCRIIEVNEQRKAKKLSELMAKLEISEDKSDSNWSDAEAQFPLTASLNEVTYSTCATLKYPSRNFRLDSTTISAAPLLPNENDPEKSPHDETSESVEDVASQQPTARGSKPLESVNLITAQSLDHRSESVPCDLNISQESN